MRPLVKHMLKIGAALSLLLATGAMAEQIRVPIGQHIEASGIDVPRKGMTTEMVRQRYGEPKSQQGPTGTPPITYWEYTDYTVYFEYNHVLHSVLKKLPK